MLGETLRTLAAVQLDRVDAVEQLRVRVHRRQHVAALFDDLVHVHPVLDGRDAEVRHAVEAAGEEDVAEPALDLHGGDVHRHHRGGAGALDAQADDVLGKPGQEGDGGARMRLLAHHLDGSEDDAVDVPAGDARPAQHLPQDDHRQVVGADVAEDPARRVGSTEWGADIADQDGVTKSRHDRRPCNASSLAGANTEWVMVASALDVAE